MLGGVSGFYRMIKASKTNGTVTIMASSLRKLMKSYWVLLEWSINPGRKSPSEAEMRLTTMAMNVVSVLCDVLNQCVVILLALFIRKLQAMLERKEPARQR